MKHHNSTGRHGTWSPRAGNRVSRSRLRTAGVIVALVLVALTAHFAVAYAAHTVINALSPDTACELVAGLPTDTAADAVRDALDAARAPR